MQINVFQKRPGAWHVDFRVDGRRFRPYGGPTRQEAERAAPALIARAASPSPATVVNQVKGPSLREAFALAMRVRDRWIKAKDKTSIRLTFAALGLPESTPMALLTRDYVRELRGRWMQEPGKAPGTTLSASTINHRLSMLAVLLDVCDLPPHGVKHLSVRGNERTRRITDAERLAMQVWCLEHRQRRGAEALAVLIELALETAARQGELLGLSWADVSFEGGTLTFRFTKNHETRTIPLTERAAALLGPRKALPAPFSDLSKGRVEALWNDMRKHMGLASDTEFVFHTLRHEAISRMVDKGKSPLVIQAIAGHSAIATTQRYAHASLAAMREALS